MPCEYVEIKIKYILSALPESFFKTLFKKNIVALRMKINADWIFKICL